MIDLYFPVLDHGFIALKDYMGSDEDIEQAARISYGKGTRQKSNTRSLIRYLLRHRHTSPLEMCELKFHVRVPMDCWRQWIRHRTASVNEYSTRYSEIPFFYQQTPPDKWRLQATDNKQGSDGYKTFDDGTPFDGEQLSFEESRLQRDAYNIYKKRLISGIAREQARKDLPLSIYTEAFWKIDLHNLFHFLKLRCDSHAQWEIRQYASIIAGIVKHIFPLSFAAWRDYTFNAVTYSYQEQQFLYRMIHYGTSLSDIIYDAEEFGLSKREIQEFVAKVNSEPDTDFNLDVSTARSYESFYEGG